MSTRGVDLGLGSVWSEEIWIHLIDTVKEVDEDISQPKGGTRKQKRKWDLVAKKLHKRLKLNSNEAKQLQPQLISNRFRHLGSLLRGTSKSLQPRQGGTPAVIQKMRNYREWKCLPCKAGFEGFKSARTCFEEDNEDDSEVFRSPHASFEDDKECDEEELKSVGTRLQEQVAKEFHALGEWFSRELIPIAKSTTFEILLSETREPRKDRLHMRSPSCSSEDLIDVSATPRKGLQLTMLADFQHLRAQISSQVKQTIKNLTR